MAPEHILLIVLAYFAVLILIAEITSRKADNQAFFIGNHKSPWFVVAFGMIGTTLSGVTFISVPGVVGDPGNVNQQFSYMQMVLGYLLGYFFIATVLMPLYYRLRLTSIYSYLEQRFGTFSYKTGAFFFLLSRTIGASFRLFLVTVVLQHFVLRPLGMPFELTVISALALIWIYTFRGGIKTIIWTDSLQTFFMLLTVALTILSIMNSLDWGMGEMITGIKESEFSRMFFWDASQDNYFFKQFFSGAFIAIVMTGLDQDMMQKNNSCRNIGDAQKNMFSFSLILVIVNLMFVSLGAMLYIYAHSQNIPIPERSDYLFPSLALHHLDPAIGVIFVIGLIAAAYSSADSALTALTTSFCVDFLEFEKKEVARSKTLRYGVHLGFSILVFATIMIFNRLEGDVLGNLFRAATYTYGPLLGLFMFGLFTNRKIKDNLSPIICVLAPVISYFIQLYVPVWFNGYQIGFEILIYNGLLTVLGLLLISEGNKKAT